MTDEERTECNTINAELDEMDHTLSGCDWCCGGGNEKYAMLIERLRLLGGKREPDVYGWWGLIARWDQEDYEKRKQERSA
tara:strand:- start:12114 stop:12353 length:240 start_codon:yes stop_codon:yes gene_type:complete